MKKIFIILFFAMTASVILFAGANDVKVNGKVDKDNYELNLYYGEVAPKNKITGVTDYQIDNDGEAFDLTKDGVTKTFYVTVSGNENIAPKVKVTYDRKDFIPFGNETGTVYKDTDKVGVLIGKENQKVLDTGYHDDSVIKTFDFKWFGNTTLTSGKYQSTVTINYTFE